MTKLLLSLGIPRNKRQHSAPILVLVPHQIMELKNLSPHMMVHRFSPHLLVVLDRCDKILPPVIQLPLTAASQTGCKITITQDGSPMLAVLVHSLNEGHCLLLVPVTTACSPGSSELMAWNRQSSKSAQRSTKLDTHVVVKMLEDRITSAYCAAMLQSPGNVLQRKQHACNS